VQTARYCPESELWRALVQDGRIDAEDRERFERHVENCLACQQRFDHGEGGVHPLLAVARQMGDPTVAPADPTLVQVLQRLHQVPSPLRSSADAPIDLYFLRSADRRDILGTLGAYEVQEVIGQGGMGVVLKAFEPALHRHVAIKVLSPTLAGSATARRRFTREAKAAAAVSHDHVVVVHGVHETDGLPYLVMAYIAGESLQDRLDRTGPLEPVEIVRIGMQTASGLAAAHAQGLIHRDIKPANLLLQNGLARVAITDFGLARAVDEVGLTQHGVVTGTPEYMSPEQARGDAIDHRADLFSLGCVLYAMATGVPPFRGETTLCVLRRVSDEPHRPVRELNPEVPAWLEMFIDRLLAKDPAQRFQTAAEVASLLEGYLAHLRQPRTVPAPTLSPTTRNVAKRRTRRLLGLTGAVLGVAAMGWLALGLLQPAGQPVQGDREGAEPPPPSVPLDVWSVAVSKDGKFLAAGSGHWDRPGEIGVWDLASRDPLQRFAEDRGVASVALSPDGKLLASGSWSGHVRVLDWAVGKQLYDFPVDHVARVAFSPDGQFLVAAAEDPNTVQVWGMAHGKLIADLPNPQGDRFRLHCVAFSPDGSRVIAGGGQWEPGGHAEAVIWDLAGKTPVGTLVGHRRPILGVCYAPDGKTIATGSIDQTVRLWDAETGECLKTLTGHKAWVEGLAFKKDGKILLSGSVDGTARLWDVASGTELKRITMAGGVRTVSFTKWDNVFAGGGMKTLKVYAGDTLQEVGTFWNGAEPGLVPMERFPITTPLPVAPEQHARSWLAAAGMVALAIALVTSLGVTAGLAWRCLRAARGSVATANALSFPCSQCGKKLKARADLAVHAGKKLKCPHCGKPTIVPALPDASPAIARRPRLASWRFVVASGLASAVMATLLIIGLWPTSAAEEPYVSRLQTLAKRVQAQRTSAIDARSYKGVTDRDLSVLAGLDHLKDLNLDHTDTTDEGLKDVARATNIVSLSLTNTQVTNTGLAELKTLTRLESLRLDRLPITDAGMANLRAFPRLKKLSLYKTGITDDGLAVLKQLPMLEEVSLDETQVSDAGLRHFHECSNLKSVRVWNTRVTNDGIAELRQALPKVKVHK
jgi:serine/threonine protein kinase/predicted RNA-binding Zn-ribbon protein involved in translation (DUF1610 family)